MAKATCFVLMGYGEKTDYRTNRVLDLEKTYKIIRSAVEESGLACVRADEIVHAGVIDKPMYDQLLHADFAIADLSTSNENAIYELGVRHALKPHTTIVIAEKQFKFPFDLGHVVIRTYTHLGVGIDFEEANRLKAELVMALRTLQSQPETDSPVYTFLSGLQPPQLPASPPPAAAPPEPGFSALLDTFREARARGEFASAIEPLEQLQQLKPDDPYVIQQLALATYKSKRPTVIEALNQAKSILEPLSPKDSADPETLGLWGAVHKRLWEEKHLREDLDAAVSAYERGFSLKRDHYNGINYAFLLDARAAEQNDPEEATADRVLARRVRAQLLTITETELASLPRMSETQAVDPEAEYWLKATRVEAMFGLGKPEGIGAAVRLLRSAAPEPWMFDSTRQQLKKLASLQSPTTTVLLDLDLDEDVDPRGGGLTRV